MRYASVCSGIEAATVAWHTLGWTPVWFSQYDPEHDYGKGPDFPSQVLEHYYPGVPNLGDMTKLRDNETYKRSEFDMLVGGTPCQSFSIAGLRGGLDDERGNLALEFVRILAEKQPRWFIWENVPGVLSSSGGADFASILSGFTGRDIAKQKFEKAGIIEGAADNDYSVAWRVLDSQYFGVPQRRRRVFVVGHLGADWRPPAAVLFERESLRRDLTPGGKKGKRTAANTRDSVGENSKDRVKQWPAETSSTLDTTFGTKQGLEDQHITGGGYNVRTHDTRINCQPDGISGTVSCKWRKGTGGPAGDEHYNLIVE